MTSGVTSASSGSLVDPEPRSATQSPTLWESNHLLSSTLECGNTDLGLHNGYQILKISRLRPSRRIHNTCICICIWAVSAAVRTIGRFVCICNPSERKHRERSPPFTMYTAVPIDEDGSYFDTFDTLGVRLRLRFPSSKGADL